MKIFIYFTNVRRFRTLYFKYLQTLILCVTMFYKMAFYYKVFRTRIKSRNTKMVKVSYILHYKCVFFPKFNKLSKFFPVVWFVTILEGVICQNNEAVYFVGDNQVINRVRVDSSKTRRIFRAHQTTVTCAKWIYQFVLEAEVKVGYDIYVKCKVSKVSLD